MDARPFPFSFAVSSLKSCQVESILLEPQIFPLYARILYYCNIGVLCIGGSLPVFTQNHPPGKSTLNSFISLSGGFTASFHPFISNSLSLVMAFYIISIYNETFAQNKTTARYGQPSWKGVTKIMNHERQYWCLITLLYYHNQNWNKTVNRWNFNVSDNFRKKLEKNLKKGVDTSSSVW